MINYKINYSEAAQNDLNEIFEYIAYSLKEFKTAQTLIRRILKEISELKTMPLRNPVYEGLDLTLELRPVKIGSYIAFYSADEDRQTVNIIRIIYGGRDFAEQF